MVFKIENAAMDSEALQAITKHLTALSKEIKEDVIVAFSNLSVGIDYTRPNVLRWDGLDELYRDVVKEPVSKTTVDTLKDMIDDKEQTKEEE